MFSFANPKYLFGCGPFSVLQSENENENNEIRAKIQMYLFLVFKVMSPGYISAQTARAFEKFQVFFGLGLNLSIW